MVLVDRFIRRGRRQIRAVAFAAAWVAATLIIALLLIQSRPSYDSSGTLIGLAALLVCTATLVTWLHSPIRNYMVIKDHVILPTKKGRLMLLVIAACAVLFALRTLVGPPLLFGLPVAAVIALVWLREPVSRRAAAYAGGLALIAGIAGLGAGWITFISPAVWAGLQVLLTLTGLLAGWGIMRHTGLVECGIGRSRFLDSGALPAIKAGGLGILLGIPWALGLVLMGSSQSETWVNAWWQPLTAIQPGIAEEAWGRVLIVPLLYLLFRLAARPRTAFTVALLVAAYWFAYLHTPGGMASVDDTLIIGTLFALPVSYLCLYRDLETAVGFHFWLDFFKFLYALLFI